MQRDSLQQLTDLIRRQSRGDQVDEQKLAGLYEDGLAQARKDYDELRRKALAGGRFSDADDATFAMLGETVAVLESRAVQKWRQSMDPDGTAEPRLLSRADLECLAEIVPELAEIVRPRPRPLRNAAVLLPVCLAGLAATTALVVIVSGSRQQADQTTARSHTPLGVEEPPASETGVGDMPEGMDDGRPSVPPEHDVGLTHVEDAPAGDPEEFRPDPPAREPRPIVGDRQDDEPRSPAATPADDSTGAPPVTRDRRQDDPSATHASPAAEDRVAAEVEVDVDRPASPEHVGRLIMQGRLVPWGSDQPGRQLVVYADRIAPLLGARGSRISMRDYHPSIYDGSLQAIFLAREDGESTTDIDIYLGPGVKAVVQDAALTLQTMTDDEGRRPEFLLLRGFEAPATATALLWLGDVPRQIRARDALMSVRPAVTLQADEQSTQFRFSLSSLALSNAVRLAARGGRGQDVLAEIFNDDKVLWDSLCQVSAVDVRGNKLESDRSCVVPLRVTRDAAGDFGASIQLAVEHDRIPNVFDEAATGHQTQLRGAALQDYVEEVRRNRPTAGGPDYSEEVRKAAAAWGVAAMRCEQIDGVLQEWETFEQANRDLERIPNYRWRNGDVTTELERYQTLSRSLSRQLTSFAWREQRAGNDRESELLARSFRTLGEAVGQFPNMFDSYYSSHWRAKLSRHQRGSSSSYFMRRYTESKTEHNRNLDQARRAIDALRAAQRFYQADLDRNRTILSDSYAAGRTPDRPTSIAIQKIRCRSRISGNVLLLWELN